MSKSKIVFWVVVIFLMVTILVGCVKTGGGKPWVDSDLKSNIKRGMKISEKDDFHLAVNYDWLLETNIPQGSRAIDSFSEAATITHQNAKEFFNDKSLKSHDAKLVQDFYNAFLDWDARNALGTEPIKKTLQDIESIKTISELSDFICDTERNYGVPVFYNVINGVNQYYSASYMAYITLDELLLLDSGEYKNQTKMGKRIYESKKDAFEKLYQMCGHTKNEADDLFDATINFESKIASVIASTAEQNDPNVVTGGMQFFSLAAFYNKHSAFPAKRFIESLGYDETYKVAFDSAVAYKMNELYKEENLSDIKAYMTVKYLLNMSKNLDRKSFEIIQKMENKISGAHGMMSYEDYAYDIAISLLPESLPKAYLEKYDFTKIKEDVTELCEKIIDTYRIMLRDETWLTEETRTRAIEKLDCIKIHAVYPDKWIDNSELSFSGLSYFDIVKSIKKFNRKIDVSKTNGNADSDFWGNDFGVMQANAFYYPTVNSINILLGILGGEFDIKDDMKKEKLYAGIGNIIAHEISHAFDTNGAQFNKDGTYSNWWQKEDMIAFQNRAAKLISFYNAIEVFDGVKVQGGLVQTEAIADMTAMKCLLEIAKDESDFDYDLFFREYAKNWKRLSTPELEYYCLTQDPHPVYYLRTNVTLQQFEKFYETYGVKDGDGMYLAPEDRVAVW